MTKENKNNNSSINNGGQSLLKATPRLYGYPELNTKLSEFLEGFEVGTYYFQSISKNTLLLKMFIDAMGCVDIIEVGGIKRTTDIKKIIKKVHNKYMCKIMIIQLIKNGSFNEQLKDMQKLSKKLGIRIVINGKYSPMIDITNSNCYIKEVITENTVSHGESTFINRLTNEKLTVRNVVAMK